MGIRLLVFFSILAVVLSKDRSFVIDYENNTFLKDGQPFRYISGSIHYFRVPRGHWEDRLKKIRAAGFNAIEFYIEWNSHEPEEGKFVFDGNLDVIEFIRIAQSLDLLVILRIGPYTCGERNYGGLVPWLLTNYPDMLMRSADPNFLDAVQRWWNVLLPMLKPQLYKNGGPVIMMQLENEYGSYGICDQEYGEFLRDLAWEHLGKDNVVLFTTDGDGEGYVKCGHIDGVYATVDFGPGGNITESFAAQRLVQPNGPYVNSEYYPGWLNYWGHPKNYVDSVSTAKFLDDLLAFGANVNIYVMHGGTSFGFGSGANFGATVFTPNPTSYDYDAPISEAGDLTEKYYAFKKVVGKYSPLPNITVHNTTKKAYGSVDMKFVSSFLDSTLLKYKATNLTPLPFEQLNQSHGFVLYETSVPAIFTDPAILNITDLRDRAYVFVNNEIRGILSRTYKISSLQLDTRPNDTIRILVENQGRKNGAMPYDNDPKGIIGQVTLGGQQLKTWKHYSMPLDNSTQVEKYCKTVLLEQDENLAMNDQHFDNLVLTRGYGSFWYGEFKTDTANDTFLSLDGWSKGIAFVNGHNLGRYWPIMGPQITLFVPAPFLTTDPKANNSIILFEQERTDCFGGIRLNQKCQVQLVDKHILNGPTPVNPGPTK